MSVDCPCAYAGKGFCLVSASQAGQKYSECACLGDVCWWCAECMEVPNMHANANRIIMGVVTAGNIFSPGQV